MDGLGAFFESDFFAIAGIFAGCLIVYLILPRREKSPAVTQMINQRSLQRNYIWLFIAIGILLIASAIVLYVHQLPDLIARTIVGLEAVFAGRTDAPGTDKTTRIRNLAYAFGALAAALTIMATIPFQLIEVWLNERSARRGCEPQRGKDGRGEPKTYSNRSINETWDSVKPRIGPEFC